MHVSVKLRGEGEIPGTPEQFHSPTRPSRRALESTLMAYIHSENLRSDKMKEK